MSKEEWLASFIGLTYMRNSLKNSEISNNNFDDDK